MEHLVCSTVPFWTIAYTQFACDAGRCFLYGFSESSDIPSTDSWRKEGLQGPKYRNLKSVPDRGVHCPVVEWRQFVTHTDSLSLENVNEPCDPKKVSSTCCCCSEITNVCSSYQSNIHTIPADVRVMLTKTRCFISLMDIVWRSKIFLLKILIYIELPLCIIAVILAKIAVYSVPVWGPTKYFADSIGVRQKWRKISSKIEIFLISFNFANVTYGDENCQERGKWHLFLISLVISKFFWQNLFFTATRILIVCLVGGKAQFCLFVKKTDLCSSSSNCLK